MPYAGRHYGELTPEGLEFVRDHYRKTYSRDFQYTLAPTLEVAFNRITLVANSGAERVTIDFDIRFSKDGYVSDALPLFIIETKSRESGGIADGVLKSCDVRSQRCSKYCLGSNIAGLDVKYNRFKPLLKRLGVLPALTQRMGVSDGT
jgi:hypothetical protein